MVHWLLTAWVDRWRPEMHMFHLQCGEATPTLQDVAYLLGPPLHGEAVGPRVVSGDLLEDLEACFTGVQRAPGEGVIQPLPAGAKGPHRTWLLQF
jgi:hypothetical protein